MIDTNKYEGHTPVREEWPRWCEDWLFNLYSGKTDDGSHIPTWNQDNALACDAPLLLAEVKRLRKLEAAVVGSWMRACDHRGPWHKALRYPCVELGYLTLDGHYFELSEEYQDMAKAWIREQNGDDEE